MCQQGRRHDRFEHLGIAGLLFQLTVCIALPVMLDNLRFGAFQNQLCADILLPDAGQCMSVGVHLFIIRQIHDSLFHRQRRAELFQPYQVKGTVAGKHGRIAEKGRADLRGRVPENGLRTAGKRLCQRRTGRG